MHEGSITIHLDADVRQIEHLNHLVRQFGDLMQIPPRTLYAVNLALDELVSNIVLYGYSNPAGEKVTVRLRTEDEYFHAVLEDAGRAFDPCTVPTPNLTAPLAERQVGGLGIHLVRNIMDDLQYRRDGVRNVLSLRKRIAPRP